MILPITPEQLRDCCDEIYRPGGYDHAPAQVLIDHFTGQPNTTFLRVSFPEKFTHACACKLDTLRKLLIERFGRDANVVFCVYLDLIDVHEMARHAVAIADR
ncbi:MAG: hypothetical protein RL461_116 [Planctomycetota bacterium]|jgi:hypothetical protein